MSSSARPTNTPPSTGDAVLRYCLRSARGPLAAAMASALIRQVAFLSMPYLLGQLVQLGIAEQDPAAVATFCGLLAAAVLVEFAGLCGWIWWANLGEARLAATVREWLLDTVLTAGEEDLDQATRGGGDLVSRAVDDVDAVLVWVHGLATWVVIACTVVVLVPAIGSLDPTLLVVTLVTALGVAAVNIVFPRRYGSRVGRAAAAQGTRAQAVSDLMAAGPTLRGVGGEYRLVDRHHRDSAGVSDTVLAAARLRSWWSASGDAVPQVGIAVGLITGGPAALDGRLDVGQLMTFALWMGTVQLAAGAIVARLGERGAALAAAGRIAQVLAAHRAGADQASDHRGAAGLVCRSIAVNRGDRHFGPIDVTATPGRWVLLTGRTGAGKSTLLRAIAGVVPHAGTVTFGGELVIGPRPDLLTLVPQNPLLLHGTVRENLLLGVDPGQGIDDDDLLAACRNAAVDGVVRSLPNGLDTTVGERGAGLSGGERQRLALARALLRGTPVLLLDDVTSALDGATEATLIERLRAATADRVVIWAGHRAAVAHAADQVLTLDRAGV